MNRPRLNRRAVWTPSLRAGETIVSYSQNAEDVRLARVFDDSSGFYVDVGAGDGLEFSVTRLFYERGWSGINIEPVSATFAALQTARPRDVNLQVAVAADEEPRDFWVSSPHSGISSLYPPESDQLPDGFQLERTTINCKPMRRILAEHAQGLQVDFMTIDVEGAEGEVIRSIDFESIRPTVLVVESVVPLTFEPSHENWESVLIDSGYVFATFDGINRYYVEGSYEDLATVLAYPVSVLDQFTRAADHEKEIELASLRGQSEELRHSLAEIRRERDRLIEENERLRAEVDDRRSLAETRREPDQVGSESDRLRAELDTVYRSRTWRAGRVVAAVGSPALDVARRFRPRRQSATEILTPAKAYSKATAAGEPWHFPRAGAAPKMGDRTPLDRLIRQFGELDVAVDTAAASALAEELARIGWADDWSLLERRLSWDERQAIVEAESVVQLAAEGPGKPFDRAPKRVSNPPAPRAVVVDARCLQDPAYRQRGVGLHSHAVLRATRAAADHERVVLLTSPELPDLDPAVVDLANELVFTPHALRETDVALFVALSPMTASTAPAIPFLASSDCRTVAVLYDFIPSEVPSAYLNSATSTLSNRARIEALRHYDFFLPISDATATAWQRILGDDARIVVTGVGDPLSEVRPTSRPVLEPFMLIPVGGDSRKNAAAAICALARHRQMGGAPLRAVVTGALAGSQATALYELTDRVGLPKDAVELRGSVPQDELASLYENAELVFVGSFAEGFSIPVAEAVLRGTPVVASDIAAHRELLGTGPWLAAPKDIEAFANALSHVRENPNSVLDQQLGALGDTAHPEVVVGRATTALEGLLAEPREKLGISPTRRARPQLAVVSPFPPQRSGIADYTAFTFREIAKYVDVEVYSAAQPDPSAVLPVQPLSAAPYLDRRFDAVVNVVGNSHFHFPVLDLMGSYGGACIAHDISMVESYGYDRGDAWTAELLSSDTRTIYPEQIPDYLLDLDRLPSLGYHIIAREASPLIVHGRVLADRIEAETGVTPAVVPFIPYNVPSAETIDDAACAGARAALGLLDDELHVATFGIVDRRTKGSDLIVGATAWLQRWGVPAHLHIVGDAPPNERQALERIAAELEVIPNVTFHGHVPRTVLEQFLLAVDVAVQIRTNAILSLSGSLSDCLVFGVPTVTTSDLAIELDAPSYVATTTPATSSLLLAEAVESLGQRRRQDAGAIEAERRDYLSRRSVGVYARALLEVLGMAPA